MKRQITDSICENLTDSDLESMGPPLSPIAADVVMDDLESKCIASLHFQLPFYYRYVDDIITTVPLNKIKTIKNIFNSYNHKIQFTIEEESEGKICFLDILIVRDRNIIKTYWYPKPTWSERFLNFYLHHPYKTFKITNQTITNHK